MLEEWYAPAMETGQLDMRALYTHRDGEPLPELHAELHDQRAEEDGDEPGEAELEGVREPSSVR